MQAHCLPKPVLDTERNGCHRSSGPKALGPSVPASSEGTGRGDSRGIRGSTQFRAHRLGLPRDAADSQGHGNGYEEPVRGGHGAM